MTRARLVRVRVVIIKLRMSGIIKYEEERSEEQRKKRAAGRG